MSLKSDRALHSTQFESESGGNEAENPGYSRIPLSAPDITEVEIAAVTAVMRTPNLSLGAELEGFESAFAAYHGVPHAVAVSSGTAGLHLALLVLNLGPGDEVVVPSFAFIAVANAVLQVGATPVFADIDPTTLNLDPAAVERVITSRTRALLVVHTFGVPADMDALGTIARRHKLAIVEDACEAIGAEFGSHSRRVGSFGEAAVFGFYPNKQITTGEGGVVLTRDAKHAARLRSLRNQGKAGAEWLSHVEIGFNYRLSELACALGRVQLSRIDEILGLRKNAAARYDALFAKAADSIREQEGSQAAFRPLAIPSLEVPPLTLPNRTISWFVYVVRLREGLSRDRVQARLATLDIATGRYFAPIHVQPAWQAHPSARAAKLPVTEGIACRMLALPFFNRITAVQQKRVVESVLRSIADSE